MLDTAEASSPANTRLMFMRALHLYKTGDVGGAAALLREISPNADDAFIATVHRLILGVTLMWLGDADRAWELLAEAARRAEDDDNRLARMCAEGYQALLAVNRGDIALSDRLAGHAESAVGHTLSDSHFVAMFPALARARLELQCADWPAPGVRPRRRWNEAAMGPDGWNSPRHCSPRRRPAGSTWTPLATRRMTSIRRRW